jgi:hypothetical protein
MCYVVHFLALPFSFSLSLSVSLTEKPRNVYVCWPNKFCARFDPINAARHVKIIFFGLSTGDRKNCSLLLLYRSHSITKNFSSLFCATKESLHHAQFMMSRRRRRHFPFGVIKCFSHTKAWKRAPKNPLKASSSLVLLPQFFFTSQHYIKGPSKHSLHNSTKKKSRQKIKNKRMENKSFRCT